MPTVLIDPIHIDVVAITADFGQSLGGCMTIVQQGRYYCYDGVGV
ncbi:MAG TPA: hypothetical protein VIR65_15635 [Rhizorhapis sp.]